MPENYYGKGLIPIVIGVTGHRDLRMEDRPALQTSIQNTLIELCQHCPNSDMVILTSLGEGADRLCARIALELGMKINVLLPMPQDEYEKDFASSQSLSEFRELMARAVNTFTLQKANHLEEYRTNRDRFYRQAGEYIAGTCQILIALWDGIDRPDLPGGTSDVVRMKLNPDMRAANSGHSALFAAAGNGAVYHILTPRVDGGAPNGEPFALILHYPAKHNSPIKTHDEKAITDILASIDGFNRDAKKLVPQVGDCFLQSRSSLYDDEKYPDLPLPLSKSIDTFAAADCMSVYYRNKRLTALKLLSILGLMLVALFLLYDELESNTMLLFYGATLIAVFACFFRFRLGGYHNKYVDYRVLAEGLRIQFYWKRAGINEEVYEHYIWGHKREISWIGAAMAAFHVYGDAYIDPVHHDAIFGDIKRQWIEGQTQYCREAVLHKGGSFERSERINQFLFAGSIMMFIAIILLEFLFGRTASALIPFSPGIARFLNMHEGLDVMVRSLMKIMFGLVAGVIAFFNNYTTNQALSEQVKEYDKMHDLYQRADQMLEKAIADRNPEFVKTVLFQLGCEALRENGNWLLIKKQRPLTLPK